MIWPTLVFCSSGLPCLHISYALHSYTLCVYPKTTTLSVCWWLNLDEIWRQPMQSIWYHFPYNWFIFLVHEHTRRTSITSPDWALVPQKDLLGWWGPVHRQKPPQQLLPKCRHTLAEHSHNIISDGHVRNSYPVASRIIGHVYPSAMCSHGCLWEADGGSERWGEGCLAKKYGRGVWSRRSDEVRGQQGTYSEGRSVVHKNLRKKGTEKVQTEWWSWKDLDGRADLLAPLRADVDGCWTL